MKRLIIGLGLALLLLVPAACARAPEPAPAPMPAGLPETDEVYKGGEAGALPSE